jgi:hypothetical protein
MKIKTHPSVLKKIFIKTLSMLFAILLILSSLFVFSPARSDADIPTFSDPLSLETDVREVIQSAFDSMHSQVAYQTSGLPAAKLLLQTDESGNLIQPFTYTSFIIETFENQLMDFSTENLNPYTRFAMNSWGITIQLRWADDPHGVVTSMDITITYSIQWIDGAEALGARNTVFSHVNSLLASPIFNNAVTDDEKLKAINQLICETFQYDYRLFVDAEKDSVIYTAYRMISDLPTPDGHPISGFPRGVCQAYAMYGYLMLRQAGYESITVAGEAGGGGHAWNMVKVGSQWYHIDYTWNDPVSRNATEPPGFPEYPKRQDGEGVVLINYLMRSDEEMQLTHSWPEEHKGYHYPKAVAIWSGVPTYLPITQENPAPTITQSPISEPVIVLSPTHSPTPTPSGIVTSSYPLESSLSSNYPSQQESSNPSDPITTGDSSQDYSDAESVSDQHESAFQPGSKTLTTTIMPTGITVIPGEQPEISSPKATVSISGFLTDSAGNPLPGMTLELFAASLVTTTDENGYYSFNEVQIGSYRIYLKDEQGNEIADLYVLIAPGDRTEMTSGKITVRGGTLGMDFMLSGNELFIRNVSSPWFEFSSSVIITGILIAVFVVIGVTSIFLRKKSDNPSDEYLDQS